MLTNILLTSFTRYHSVNHLTTQLFTKPLSYSQDHLFPKLRGYSQNHSHKSNLLITQPFGIPLKPLNHSFITHLSPIYLFINSPLPLTHLSFLVFLLMNGLQHLIRYKILADIHCNPCKSNTSKNPSSTLCASLTRIYLPRSVMAENLLSTPCYKG